MPLPVHGYKFRIPGTSIEVTLVTKGEGQGVRVKKGGTIYDVYLVATTDPKATKIKIKHPTLGIMSLREYAAFMLQKLLEETLTLTDSIYQKFIRQATDGIGFVDSVIKFLGGIVSLEETLTLIDSITGRMWGTLTDALNLADEIFKKHIRAPADSFSLSDATTRYFSSLKEETLSLVDSIGRKTRKSIGDTLTFTDQVFEKYVRTPADSFSFGDTVAGFLTSIKAETLSLGDSISKKLKVVKDDSLSLADTIVGHLKGLTSDAFSFADSTVRSFQKGVGETLSLTDQLFIGPLRKLLSETLSLGDTFSGFMSGVKAETLSLTDSLTALFTRLTSDSFSFADSVDGFLFSIKTETLSLGDAITKKLKKVLTDALSLGDTIVRQFRELASDTFSFADSTIRSFQKGIGDTLSLADELFIGPLRKTLTESLNLTDAFSGFMSGVKSETLTLSDAISKVFTRLVADSFSFGDSIAGYLTSVKAETLSLIDVSLKKFGLLLPPPAPSGGMVAEYDMDEGEGGTIYDTSGQGNHGIINGAIWVLGLVGWALGFDGDNDFVNLGTSLLNNPDAGTVCFWLFPTANGQSGAKPYWNTTILNKGWCYEAIQQLSDNKIRIYFYDGVGWAWLDSINSLILNQWNCVIYAWDANGSTIYLAGVPDVVSETKTWADYHAGHFDQPLHLGGYTVESLPYYFEGPIDKGRFYTRRFSDEEAAQLTRRGLTRDSLRLGDSLLQGFGAVASDMFDLADTVAGYFTRTLTEGLTLTDQLFIGPLKKILTETLILADSIARRFIYPASDSFNFGDNINGFLFSIKTEALSLGDTLTRKLRKTLSDGFELVDTTLKHLSGVVGDGFSFADSSVRSFQKSVEDGLSLADEIFIGPLRKILEESLNLSDTFTGFMAGVKTEVLALTDGFTRALAGLTTDSFNFADSVVGYLKRTLTETLTLADSLTQKAFKKAIAETLSLGDAIGKTLGQSIDDTLNFADSIFKRDFFKNIGETLSLGDTFSGFMADVKTEILSLGDAILRVYIVIIPSGVGGLSGWDNRFKIGIDSGDVDAALSGFPVLINISSSFGINADDITAIFDEVGANRKKIAVTKGDGVTQCYVEIEKWDAVAEEASLWVKIPDVNPSVDSVLFLYYDNTQPDNDDYVGDPNSTPAENVWDANFTLVTHLQDDPGTSNVRDSTSNDHDGTKTGANQPIETTDGQIGDAQDFDGEDDLINFGVFNPAGDSNKQLSAAIWFKGPEGDYSLSKWEPNALNFFLGIAAGGFYVVISDQPTWDPAHVKYYVNTVDYRGTTRRRFSFTWDGNLADTSAATRRLKLFVNGIRIADVTLTKTFDGNITTVCNSATPFLLGHGDHPGVYIDGILDESRLSGIARTLSWEKASHESERDHLLYLMSDPGDVEGFSFADSVIGYFKQTLTEGLTLADQIFISPFRKTLTEALSLVDVLSQTLDGILSDDFNFADAISGFLTSIKSETLSLGDSIGREFLETLAENLPLADAITQQKFRTSLSDSFGFGDSAIKTRGTHSDVIHSDVPPVEHSDNPGHSDHSEQFYSDEAYSDLTHSDITHSDAGPDIHSNVVHSEIAGHPDHTDLLHSEVYASNSPAYSDHTDESHSNVSHSDESHSDVGHSDAGPSSHSDEAHSNVAYYSDHNDVLHGNVTGSAHSEASQHSEISHSDTASHSDHSEQSHSNVSYSDQDHSNISHSNVSPSDQSHSNITAHSDHDDVLHSDQIHSDGAAHSDHSEQAHSNVPHSDQWHSNILHSDAGPDQHSDEAHSEIAAHSDHNDILHSNIVEVPHSEILHSEVAHSEVF